MYNIKPSKQRVYEQVTKIYKDLWDRNKNLGRILETSRECVHLREDKEWNRNVKREERKHQGHGSNATIKDLVGVTTQGRAGNHKEAGVKTVSLRELVTQPMAKQKRHAKGQH